MVSHLLLLAAAVAGGCMATAPSSRPEGQARIRIERGETYLVHALFDGVSTEALTYRLEVVRAGPAGRSRSSQSGAFASAESRTDTLSTVRVSAAPGDRFEARLVVTRGTETVSESTVEETVR